MPECGPTVMEGINLMMNTVTVLGLAYISTRWGMQRVTGGNSVDK